MSSPPGFILEAALWDGNSPTASPTEDLAPPAAGLLWANVIADDRDSTEALLKGRFGFNELEVEDALSLAERPTVTESDNHMFLVAPFVHTTGMSTPEEFSEVAFFIQERRVVTVGLSNCPLIRKAFEKWMADPHRYGYSPGDLLHSLLDMCVDAYFPAMDVLEDVVEELEDAIYGGGREVIREALAVKRRLLEMRRHVAPLRDVINGLLRRDLKFLAPEMSPYIQDLYDHTIRITEAVDLTRDILVSVLDAHLAIVSNNLNEVMKKMTVIATLLTTAAVVVGIYGMNFDYMPELHWNYGYQFSLGLIGFLCLIELWFFRKQRWI